MPIPARPSVIPYLIVEEADHVIDFCQQVFEAELLGKLMRPDGNLMHAELAIGDSRVMLGTPMGEFEPTPGMVFVTVDDCDAAYHRTIEAGATVLMEMTTMEHAGERYGGVLDKAGNSWWIATQQEEVSWEQQQQRIDSLADQEFGQ